MEYIKLSGQILAGYEELAAVFAKHVQRYGGGAALCVYREGQPVIDIWAGVKNNANDPWLAKTSSVSFSATKGVLSTLLHWLMDQEGLSYDIQVSSLWPEFRSEGKKHISIRDLLSHEAGLFKIRSLIDSSARMLDWGYMTDVLAKSTPSSLGRQADQTSGKQAYHGLSYGWLVGEVIRRLSGKLPGQLLEEAFVQPMALTGAMIGVPERKLSSVAHLIGNPLLAASEDSKRALSSRKLIKRSAKWFWKRSASLIYDKNLLKEVFLPQGMREFKFDSADVLRAQIPAANGVFDARSLAKLYSMIAMGGKIENKRYLSEKRLNEMFQQQSKGLDAVIRFPMGWRLGYHRVFNFSKGLPNGMGHYGYGGSGAWADKDTGTSMGYVVNAGSGTPFGDFRIWELSSKLLRIMRKT